MAGQSAEHRSTMPLWQQWHWNVLTGSRTSLGWTCRPHGYPNRSSDCCHQVNANSVALLGVTRIQSRPTWRGAVCDPSHWAPSDWAQWRTTCQSATASFEESRVAELDRKQALASSMSSTPPARFGRATDAAGPAHHGLGSLHICIPIVFDGALRVCVCVCVCTCVCTCVCHVMLFGLTPRSVIDRTTHAWRLIKWLCSALFCCVVVMLWCVALDCFVKIGFILYYTFSY